MPLNEKKTYSTENSTYHSMGHTLYTVQYTGKMFHQSLTKDQLEWSDRMSECHSSHSNSPHIHEVKLAMKITHNVYM